MTSPRLPKPADPSQDVNVAHAQKAAGRLLPLVENAIASMSQPRLGSDKPRAHVEGDLITCNRVELARVIAREVAAALAAERVHRRGGFKPLIP